MSPALIFKNVMKNVGVLLKEYGYSKTGSTFYKQKDGNWSILNFQKSCANTKDEIRFTLNIGIALQAIREFFDLEKSKNKPEIYRCHWRHRIGDYIANDHDLWWSLNGTTDANLLCQEIKQALIEQVLPTIDANISDDQLLTVWSSGKGPGSTEIQRLIYIAVLFKKKGMDDQIAMTF